MSVLVDTSVWIEFFQKKPSLDLSRLEWLLEERHLVTCLPVKSELLSGDISPSVKAVISEAFDALIHVDPDWNSAETWEKVVRLSQEARKQRLKMPGMIDRMILVAAQEAGTEIWTLDRNLQKLATAVAVKLIE